LFLTVAIICIVAGLSHLYLLTYTYHGSIGDVFEMWTEEIEAGKVYPGSSLLAISRFQQGLTNIALGFILGIFGYGWYFQRKIYLKVLELVSVETYLSKG
jgi:hypothetical protein